MPQQPFKPTEFAFTEENIPNPTFTEEDLGNPEVVNFVKGTAEAASDEALLDSPKHLQSPEALQALLAKGQMDASDEGGFTDNLSSSEKVALGLLAIMPLLGGAIGGEDGALIGVGAGGQGLTAFGKMKFEDEKRQAQRAAQKRKSIKDQDRFDEAEAGKDRRAGIRAAATTKAQQLALNKEDRQRVQQLRKDWNNDAVRKAYDEVRVSDGKLQAALKGNDGISNLVGIVAFQKGLDPGSVVRESEVIMVKQAQGVLGRMENILGSATGKTLSEAAKKQMSKLSTEFVKIHEKLVVERAKNRREEAEIFGLNPEHIIPSSFFKSLGTSGESPKVTPKGSSTSGTASEGAKSGALQKSGNVWKIK